MSELVGYRIPKSIDAKKGLKFDSKDPNIVRLEPHMIIYLPLPDDAYKVDKWRLGNRVMGVWISKISS